MTRRVQGSSWATSPISAAAALPPSPPWLALPHGLKCYDMAPLPGLCHPFCYFLSSFTSWPYMLLCGRGFTELSPSLLCSGLFFICIGLMVEVRNVSKEPLLLLSSFSALW